MTTSLSLHEQQLLTIIQQVQVLDNQTYSVGEEKINVFFQQPYLAYSYPMASFGNNENQDEKIQKKNLIQHLCNTLYTRFYCGINKLGAIKKLQMPSQKAKNDFMKILSQSNHSTQTPDPNWSVYAVNDNGSAFAEKNGQFRPVQPNTYILDSKQTQLAINQSIQFHRQKENKTAQAVFYYVYSNAYFAADCDIIRIYWNIKPEGAAILIEQITRVLNDYRIPFNFKCLNHPSLYRRSDAAVLYFDKVDLAIINILLPTILQALQAYLKKTIPYFTDLLVAGVSRAEDPGGGQSFGMNRCSFIAEALYQAFEHDIKQEEKRFAYLKAFLRQKGINPSQMAINPYTKHFLLKH